MSNRVEDKDQDKPEAGQASVDEQPGSAAANETAGKASSQTAAGTPAQPVRPASAKSDRRGGGGKLLLALALLSLVFAAWYYSRDAINQARDSVETARDTLSSNQQQIAELAGSIGQLQRNQQNLQQTLTDLIQDQQNRMAGLEARLDERQGYSSERWQVAEARYLARLADQRVRIAGDVATAIGLLEQANAMLRDTGQARYTATRAALIEDISRLRAAGEVDTQGLYLQISAVGRRLAEQPLRSVPGFAFGESTASPVPSAGQGWWQSGLAWLKSSLSQVLLVRRADETSQWMLDNASESAIRAQVGLLNTQALSALLAGNQDLYQQSLANLVALVRQHYEPNGGQQLLLQQLDDLASASLNRSNLNLDRSLQAMDDALRLAERAGD